MTPEIVTQKLKRYWHIDDLLLVAEYRRSEKNPRFGFFTNFSANDRKVSYPDGKGHVIIHLPHSDNLTIGQYYGVRVRLATDNKSDNPYLIELEEVLEIEGYDSPREFIKKWFSSKGENPGDAATIASQLRLNELELYTQTERFIFELLQNADDMPTKNKKVNVSMELLGDYFLFLHDGKFFDRNDVTAIADAARSTKSRDKTKTGYKGIGFKSVFTDSTRVFIKSHDYSFKFDKLHPIYSDFWQLYGKYVADSSEAKQNEIRRKYTGREDEFTQIERIPWQIKPIWVERAEFPPTLNTATFQSSHNVAIGLEIGESTLTEKQYHQKITNLLGEPRFLLFLRNITSVAYKHNSHSSTLAMEQVTESQFNIRFNNVVHSTYTKWEADITISNESFAAAGLHFQKRTLQDGKYEFVTDDGQLIKNIPEKLSILDKTALSFAAQIQGDNVQSIPKEEAILFNYLPTSDKRFEFPFLVNADFVTKTDREFILHENLWNQYLFYHIGYLHVAWLRELARTVTFQSSYLSLLVSRLKDESDQSEGEINAAFNRGLRQAVAVTPFIRTESGRIALSTDIILDETELSSVLGNRLFYTLTGTTKKLPDPHIKPSILRRGFLGIEPFNVETLAGLLAKPESVALLTEVVRAFNESQYNAFLTWLDRHCQENPVLFNPLVPTLPFFRFGDETLSWSAVANRDDCLMLDNRTDGLRTELTALGFTVSALSIDQFPALKSALAITKTYLDTDTLLYDKISPRCSQFQLTPVQKATLFTFFAGLNDIGKEKYARTLCLFANEAGVCRPLDKLVDPTVSDLPAWLSTYEMARAEFDALPLTAARYVVKATNLFSQLLCDPTVLANCTNGLDSKHLSDWTNQLLTWRAKDDVSPSIDWNELPWLYTTDQHRFRSANQLWHHAALDKIPAQAAIELLTGWQLPHPACQPLIEQFSLLLRSDKITDKLVSSDVVLREQDASFLLCFLIESGESKFLSKFQIKTVQSGFQIKALPPVQRLFIAENDLSDYVKTSQAASKLAQLPAVFGSITGVEKLGVLNSTELIEWLIGKDAQLALTPFVVSLRNNALGESFLKKLPSLFLNSSQIYGSTSVESLAIQLARRVYVEKDQDVDKSSRNAFVSMLRAKILLDGNKPENRLYQEKVTIKIEDRVQPAFNLSELLPQYSDSSLLVEKLIKGLTALDKSDQRFLRNDLFSSTSKKIPDIVAEIGKLNEPYLTPLRTIFLLMCEQSDPAQFKAVLTPFKERVFDDVFNNADDTHGLNESYAEFLTHAYQHQFVCDTFGFYGVDLSELVDAPEAIDAELFPDWLTTWTNLDNSRREFLQEWGVNGPDSDVVELRRSMMAADSGVASNLITELRNNKPLLLNTMRWLFEQQTPERVFDWLTPIYELLNQLVNEPDGQKYIPVRLPVQEGEAIYRLIEFSDQPLHLLHEEWAEHTGAIFSHIESEGGYLIESDMTSSVRAKISYVDDDDLTVELPEDFEGECSPFNNELYQSWEAHKQYPIYVFGKNALPWMLWYDGIPIIDVDSDQTAHFLDNKTYLTIGEAYDFPDCLLETDFPATQLKHLLKLYKNQDRDEYAATTVETDIGYSSGADKIKQAQELSKEDQKNWHKEAVDRGRNYLSEEGHDFSNHSELPEAFSYKYDSRVVTPDGSLVNVYYRSAKGGLLYLNPGLWKKLAQQATRLVVIYEDGEPRVFSSQEGLLKEKYNPYMLYRVKNNKQVATVNAVAEQLEDESGHLLFVTGPNSKDRLFDVFNSQPGDVPMSDTSTGTGSLW